MHSVFRCFLVFISLVVSTFVFANKDYEKALKAYNTNDVDSAYIHVKNALQIQPDNLSAKILFASILNNKKMYQEAESEISFALNSGADKNLVIEVLGISLLRQGKYNKLINLFDESELSEEALFTYKMLKANAFLASGEKNNALEYYKILIQQYPEDIEVGIGLASIYIAVLDLPAAQKTVDKFRALYPKDARIHRYQGIIYYSLGEFENALKEFLAALEIEPESELSLRGAVNNYIALEQYELAHKVVDKLIKIAPYDPQARLLSSIIYKGLDKEEESTDVLKRIADELSSIDQTFMLSQPQLMLIDAMASYNLSNWEQALKKFNKYLTNSENTDLRAVVLLADIYKRVGKYSAAMDVLRRYEKELTENKDYALLLAGLYLQYGRSLDAKDVLTKLRAIYGDDKELLFLEAHLLSKKNKVDEAINLLESVNFDQDVNYKHTLAVLLIRGRRYADALKLTQELMLIDEHNQEYRLLNVNALLAAGNSQKASQIIEEMFNQDPNNQKVKTAYAKVSFSKNNRKLAKKLLGELVQRYPNKPINKLLLAEVEYSLRNIDTAISLLYSLTTEPVFQQRALVKLSNIYLEQNNVRDAKSVTNQLLRIDILDPTAIYLNAKVLILEEEYSAALSEIKKLSLLWKDDWNNLLKLSILQATAKDYISARTSIDQALQLNPSSSELMLTKVKLEMYFKEVDSARTLLTQLALNADVEQAEVENLFGELAILEGELEKAFSSFSSALLIDPNYIPAFRNLSQLGKKKRFSDRYIDTANRLLNHNADIGLYRMALAEHLLMYKKYDLAAYHYQLVLTKPISGAHRAFALNNLASISLKKKQFELALSYAKQAVKILPGHPAILDSTGWAYAMSGNYEKGLYYLRMSYSLFSDSPDVLYHLSYTLHKMARLVEAKVYLNLLKSFSDYEDLENVLLLMDELGMTSDN